jgi:lysozyme
MNKEILKQRLIIDEGKKNRVYKDHLGYLTVGIGHLVIKTDMLNEGDEINENRINNLFDTDISIAIEDCYKIFGKSFIERLEENKQHALINLSFNLGYNNLIKFRKFISAVLCENFDKAVNELKNSLWYKQVQKSRSEYIINNLRG